MTTETCARCGRHPDETRETAASKANRLLARGRLDVVQVEAHTIRATCRGDHDTYVLGWQGHWWCSCPSYGTRCSHLVALRLVTLRAPRGGK